MLVWAGGFVAFAFAVVVVAGGWREGMLVLVLGLVFRSMEGLLGEWLGYGRGWMDGYLGERVGGVECCFGVLGEGWV